MEGATWRVCGTPTADNHCQSVKFKLVVVVEECHARCHGRSTECVPSFEDKKNRELPDVTMTVFEKLKEAVTKYEAESLEEASL